MNDIEVVNTTGEHRLRLEISDQEIEPVGKVYLYKNNELIETIPEITSSSLISMGFVGTIGNEHAIVLYLHTITIINLETHKKSTFSYEVWKRYIGLYRYPYTDCFVVEYHDFDTSYLNFYRVDNGALRELLTIEEINNLENHRWENGVFTVDIIENYHPGTGLYENLIPQEDNNEYYRIYNSVCTEFVCVRLSTLKFVYHPTQDQLEIIEELTDNGVDALTKSGLKNTMEVVDCSPGMHATITTRQPSGGILDGMNQLRI